MVCEVKVIEDSVNTSGVRLITFQLRYWRAFHSELMTHRVFSRNASSSRAIPVQVVLDQVRDDPAGPIQFMKNKPGMQSTAALSPEEEAQAREIWLRAAKRASESALELMGLGVHKQFANRLLEPFQYISVVLTSTAWDNWYALRDHVDAMPEIRELAHTMNLAAEASTPRLLLEGQWHLPYVTYAERGALPLLKQIQCSAARCARVSYLTHDQQEPEVEKDMALYERLIGSIPMHASPIEHQATPESRNPGSPGFVSMSGNFDPSWVQWRKVLENHQPKAVGDQHA